MTLYDDPHAPDDTDELDVRQIPKSQRHPMIFARFDALAAGESFVLVNSHDPIHLREEFARDRPAPMTGAICRAASPTDCGGSGSSASPNPTSPACSDTTSGRGQRKTL